MLPPISPPIAEETKDKEPASRESSGEIDALEKIDLPPLPEKEKNKNQPIPSNKLSKPIQLDEGKQDNSDEKVPEDPKTELLPASKDPLPPSIPVEISPTSPTKARKSYKKGT